MNITLEEFYFVWGGGLAVFLGIALLLASEVFDFLLMAKEKKASHSLTASEVRYNASSGVISYQDKVMLSLRVGSVNHRFVDYMFKNRGRFISFEELHLNADIPCDRYIRKLLGDLRLPKLVKESLFEFEGNTIQLRSFD